MEMVSTADGSSMLRMQVMSQQTQLPRVIEYFNRWIAKWPTVQVTPVWALPLCVPEARESA